MNTHFKNITTILLFIVTTCSYGFSSVTLIKSDLTANSILSYKTQASLASSTLGGSELTVSDLQTSIDNIKASLVTLGSTSTSGTIKDYIANVSNSNSSATSIDANAATISDAITTVNTAIGGSGTTLTRIQNIKTSLDDSLSSLPDNNTYATVSSAASLSNNTVSIVFSAGLGNANGTYSYDVNSSINNNSSFTLNNNSHTLTLINKSGSTINNASALVYYLNSMYPVGSKISTIASDQVSSLNSMIGGTSTSLRSKIASIDRNLLHITTGVLNNDLHTVRLLIVDSPATTFQDDVSTINLLLNGNGSGSTVQSRIGNPTVNSGVSDICTVIGGSGTEVFSRLGDPVTGTSGLAGLIKNNKTINNSIFNSNQIQTVIGNFNNATSLNDQLSAFLSLFSVLKYQPIVFSSQTDPTCLADIINGLAKAELSA